MPRTLNRDAYSPITRGFLAAFPGGFRGCLRCTHAGATPLRITATRIDEGLEEKTPPFRAYEWLSAHTSGSSRARASLSGRRAARQGVMPRQTKDLLMAVARLRLPLAAAWRGPRLPLVAAWRGPRLPPAAARRGLRLPP